jgi:hypothetical protein
MSQYNQCFAPTSTGRCRNRCITNSKHCELHNPKATKLYIRYKNLSNQVKNLNINKKFKDVDENIKYVVECYNLYNKTYDARLKHRKFAIAPNLYDEGHDYQFVSLTKKINECEEILNKLYEKLESISSSDTSNSSRSEEENNAIVVYNKKKLTISEKIKLNRAYRRNKQQEIDDYVEKYIEENKLIIERRLLLIYNLCNCISLLFDSKDTIEFPKIIASIHLAMKLNNIDYFTQSFVPKRCEHPGCNCAVEYGLTLGAEHFQDPMCFCQYMELFSEDALKFIFNLFLFNKKKLLPFVSDINELYEEYESDIIFINVRLKWKNNRLNLLEK